MPSVLDHYRTWQAEEEPHEVRKLWMERLMGRIPRIYERAPSDRTGTAAVLSGVCCQVQLSSDAKRKDVLDRLADTQGPLARYSPSWPIRCDQFHRWEGSRCERVPLRADARHAQGCQCGSLTTVLDGGRAGACPEVAGCCGQA